MADIGDGHQQPEIFAVTLCVHGVVEVARVGAVNGDQWHIAQVDSRRCLGRIDMTAKSLRFMEHFGTEFLAQVEARDCRLGRHLDRALRIQSFAHPGLAGHAFGRIALDVGDDPVTGLCALRARVRDGAHDRQPPVRGAHAQIVALAFDHAEKGAETALQDTLDGADPAVLRVLVQREADAIALYQPRHFARRQKYSALHALDAREAEASAIR